MCVYFYGTFPPQVTVWDSGHLPNNALTMNISIESLNDEPPRLTSDLIHYHTEEGGPAPLLTATAALYDADNCPEHRLIAELRLELSGFVVGEDRLLDATDHDITTSQSGEFEFGSGSSVFGSGFGEWMSESQNISLTCDQTVYPECYNSILRGLQYHNTAEEPTTSNRTITVQVSIITSYGVAGVYSRGKNYWGNKIYWGTKYTGETKFTEEPNLLVEQNLLGGGNKMYWGIKYCLTQACF